MQNTLVEHNLNQEKYTIILQKLTSKLQEQQQEHDGVIDDLLDIRFEIIEKQYRVKEKLTAVNDERSQINTDYKDKIEQMKLEKQQNQMTQAGFKDYSKGLDSDNESEAQQRLVLKFVQATKMKMLRLDKEFASILTDLGQEEVKCNEEH